MKCDICGKEIGRKLGEEYFFFFGQNFCKECAIEKGYLILDNKEKN